MFLGCAHQPKSQIVQAPRIDCPAPIRPDLQKLLPDIDYRVTDAGIVVTDSGFKKIWADFLDVSVYSIELEACIKCFQDSQK